jgi:hypothetical protein
MAISSDDLVRRNAAFAATGAFAGLPFPTNETLQVLAVSTPGSTRVMCSVSSSAKVS